MPIWSRQEHAEAGRIALFMKRCNVWIMASRMRVTFSCWGHRLSSMQHVREWTHCNLEGLHTPHVTYLLLQNNVYMHLGGRVSGDFLVSIVTLILGLESGGIAWWPHRYPRWLHYALCVGNHRCTFGALKGWYKQGKSYYQSCWHLRRIEGLLVLPSRFCCCLRFTLKWYSWVLLGNVIW